jgi:hypothetical protein
VTTTPATFPNELLAYLEVAVTRPLGPGAIAHRPLYYWTIDADGRHEYLTKAACQPTTTRPTGAVDRNGDPVQARVPANPCTSMSASWAQSHGAIRCTDPACYPLPDTKPATAAPKKAAKRAAKTATKTAAKPAKKATTGGTSRRQGGTS